MAPISESEEAVIQCLTQTRSVGLTATLLDLPVDRVQRVAMMAFGLGRLEIDLVDY